jgi:hypothetical protein
LKKARLLRAFLRLVAGKGRKDCLDASVFWIRQAIKNGAEAPFFIEKRRITSFLQQPGRQPEQRLQPAWQRQQPGQQPEQQLQPAWLQPGQQPGPEQQQEPERPEQRLLPSCRKRSGQQRGEQQRG